MPQQPHQVSATLSTRNRYCPALEPNPGHAQIKVGYLHKMWTWYIRGIGVAIENVLESVCDTVQLMYITSEPLYLVHSTRRSGDDAEDIFIEMSVITRITTFL